MAIDVAWPGESRPEPMKRYWPWMDRLQSPVSRPRGTARSPLLKTSLHSRTRAQRREKGSRGQKHEQDGKPFHRERSSTSLFALYVSPTIAEAKFWIFLRAVKTRRTPYRKS